VDGLGPGAADQQELAETQTQEAPDLEAQDDSQDSQTSPPVTLTAWIQQRPRAVIITLAVLAVPYLIICSGLAILLASGLAGGTCGS